MKPPTFLSKLNRNTRFFLLSDGLSIAGYNVIDVFLSILITEKVAKDNIALVGYVLSYYTIVRIVSEMAISNVSKKFTPQFKIKLIASSYFAYGILVALMGFSMQVWHIFLFQTIFGILDGMTYPLKWAIFSEIVKKENKESSWALEDIITTLAYAVAAAFMGWISRFGLQYVFISFGIMFTSGGLVFRFIKMPRIKRFLVI